MQYEKTFPSSARSCRLVFFIPTNRWATKERMRADSAPIYEECDLINTVEPRYWLGESQGKRLD